ncbi:hypothetical protein QTO34_001386 [Cnephaeus nilssonii]|uniref:DDE-1 domain-containing protein n=1 Tax=Cnephaeus nilssonii TaxID=3371016 RepID=A0AA40HWJ5_CNENI|nr:hypothetical protein QTO34_001386 [Eptesicus nilssonii]
MAQTLSSSRHWRCELSVPPPNRPPRVPPSPTPPGQSRSGSPQGPEVTRRSGEMPHHTSAAATADSASLGRSWLLEPQAALGGWAVAIRGLPVPQASPGLLGAEGTGGLQRQARGAAECLLPRMKKQGQTAPEVGKQNQGEEEEEPANLLWSLPSQSAPIGPDWDWARRPDQRPGRETPPVHEFVHRASRDSNPGKPSQNDAKITTKPNMHKMILDLKLIYDGANMMESSWDFDMEVFVPSADHPSCERKGKALEENEKCYHWGEHRKRVSVVWIEDQTSYNVPLSKSLIQSKALALQFYESWGRGRFMRFKERRHLCNINVQGEAASVEAADDANPILPVLYKWNSKAWMRAHLLATWFTESFKPYYVETFSSEKKIFLSKYHCSVTMHLVTQELRWRCTMGLMLFSFLLTEHSFCSPWVKKYFPISSLIIEEILFLRL